MDRAFERSLDVVFSQIHSDMEDHRRLLRELNIALSDRLRLLEKHRDADEGRLRGLELEFAKLRERVLYA